MSGAQHGRDWLTVVETASELGVSEATIRRWIDEGTLPAWKPGTRTTRIPRSAISDARARAAANTRHRHTQN